MKTEALVGRCCGLLEETRNQRLMSPRQPRLPCCLGLAVPHGLSWGRNLDLSVLILLPSTPTVSTLYFVLNAAFLLPDQGMRWPLSTQAGVQIWKLSHYSTRHPFRARSPSHPTHAYRHKSLHSLQTVQANAYGLCVQIEDWPEAVCVSKCMTLKSRTGQADT